MTPHDRTVDSANAEFYDTDAVTYDASRFDDEFGGQESVRLRDLLARRLPDAPGLRVLEVGCGTGRATQWLAPRADQLTLVDVSPVMLAAAGDRAKRANPDVDVVATRASAFSLPFAAGDFDVVVSINMLGHLADAPGAIEELARVLRTDGTMVVSTPSLYSIYLPAAFVVNRRREAFGQRVYSRWPSRSTISGAFDRSSMTVESVDGAVHVPRAVRRLPVIPGLLSVADRLAARNDLTARLAPWLLWTARKNG